MSRGVDPIDSAVLTIGKIDGGTVENIIPDECCIYGTVRTLSKETQDYMTEGLKRISQHVAEAHLCEATYIHKPGYPNTTNSKGEARFMGEVMQEMVGNTNAFLDIARHDGRGFRLHAGGSPWCLWLDRQRQGRPARRGPFRLYPHEEFRWEVMLRAT